MPLSVTDEECGCLDCYTAEVYRELARYRRQGWWDKLLVAAAVLVSYGLVLFILWAV